ncbi:IclR family transcriptional regulator [Pedobacter sp. Leaf41]|jgi:DNA-binding IclR family transcriptional regulator|uniref:IclR family transcriptional regulator n=1 Tax=Pedobacter sp. Leaf41 TaxID=1736218 RepID=UPI0007032CF6|nr:IclR family transcriptional regulator C-terminal domain-containing protein [Pedobacter sp. Leaf41]KQN37214.1 IclR family transcriptional regulator [Pedobacter sp. Leaf41]
MIQVINRAFDILEFIAREPDKPKVLGEISQALNLNPGTCSNIIKTMMNRKYIEKAEFKKGYILGSAAYNLTGNEGYRKGLIDVSRSDMELLTSEINENSELSVLQNDLRLVLLRVKSDHDVQARTASEKRAYDTAAGRIMLAYLGDSELEAFVQKFGLPKADEWSEAKSLSSFFVELSKIREIGYAIQISVNQIVGLAVPLFKDEKIIACLGMYMPTYRYDMLGHERILQSIIKTGKSINEKLNLI